MKPLTFSLVISFILIDSLVAHAQPEATEYQSSDADFSILFYILLFLVVGSFVWWKKKKRDEVE
jgi:hypothetical protein